jgi:hypothetical protein
MLLLTVMVLNSVSFHDTALSFRRLTAFKHIKASEDGKSDYSAMTIAEKEKDFQNSLDSMLAEARTNNAATGNGDGEFSNEALALASIELKKLKADDITEKKISLSLNAKDIATVKDTLDDKIIIPNTPAGTLKTVAIFFALTIAFAAFLLPIIDKIFPDPPAIDSSVTTITSQ